jgi:replicative DNA helicase
MTSRTPPNDEQAEQALLGHTLNKCAIPAGVNGLTPGDFYRPDNETIWAAIRSLTDQGKRCDIHAVRDYLQECGKLSPSLTPIYLLDMLQAPQSADPA